MGLSKLKIGVSTHTCVTERLKVETRIDADLESGNSIKEAPSVRIRPYVVAGTSKESELIRGLNRVKRSSPVATLVPRHQLILRGSLTTRQIYLSEVID